MERETSTNNWPRSLLIFVVLAILVAAISGPVHTFKRDKDRAKTEMVLIEAKPLLEQFIVLMDDWDRRNPDMKEMKKLLKNLEEEDLMNRHDDTLSALASQLQEKLEGVDVDNLTAKAQAKLNELKRLSQEAPGRIGF